MGHHFSVLHVSDLHERGPREPDAWRRRRVLGDGWLRNLDELCQDGPIDLVCFTGDLADWGKAEEYSHAAEFLDELLQRLGLPRERLFLVPGNHDIDRMKGTAAERAWKKLRECAGQLGELELSRWLRGGATPRGCKAAWRDETLRRQAAYRAFLRQIGRELLLPERSPHGLLGYRVAVQLPGLPFAVQIVGLDSSWLCGDEHDAGKLRLTEDQVMRLCTDDQGHSLPGYRLALMHHPLTELADGTACRRLLAEHVELLLRGHLHETEPELWCSPSRSLRQVAAGCLYEGHHADKWANACVAMQITCGDSGHPLRYELRFRGFSARAGHWFDDGSLYKEAPHGRLRLALSAEDEAAQAPRQKQLFVGRESELGQLHQHLLSSREARAPVAVCAVQGMAGIGKTYLCEHFAALYLSAFPGGYHRLTLSPAQLLTAQTVLDDLADRLSVRGAPERQGATLRQALRHALVHIDNVDSEAQAEAVAQVAEVLRGCPLLVSGRQRSLGSGEGWQKVSVPTLDEATTYALLCEELRRGNRSLAAAEILELRTLAGRLGGLPLAVHLCGATLRRGYSVGGLLKRLDQQVLDLQPEPDSQARREQQRAVLRTSFELSAKLLHSALGAEGERLIAALRDFAHAPPAGVGLSLGAALAGLEESELELLLVSAHSLSLVEPVLVELRTTPGWRIHPLLAEFLRSAERHEVIRQRLHHWFFVRLVVAPAGQEAEQGIAWSQAREERAALQWWLQSIPVAELGALARHVFWFAYTSGPFQLWAAACERALLTAADVETRANLLWLLSCMAQRSGDFDRALSAARDKEQIERERNAERELALTRGRIADILKALGQLDEALRIRRVDMLPVFEKLGDVRERAVTISKIADILQIRGQLDEALHIWREDVLPIFEKLGDTRSYAMTMAKLADVLQIRGQLDEALRIRRAQVLPAFEKLGDIRSCAVTIGKIADILQVQGQLDEALHIRREEVLPVLERLGAIRERAVTVGKIADIMQIRGQLDEALHLRREESLPVFEKLGDIRLRAVTLGKIADILQAQGQLDEALRMRREEVLPVFEKLGDMRLRAVAVGRIADILQERGQLDEALHIRREEELPAFAKLGAMREHAVTMGKITDILQIRAQLDEARMQKEEELPVGEKFAVHP